MRHGQIAALRCADIDFTAGRLLVRHSLVRVNHQHVLGPVKTEARIRSLPLVPLTRAALLAQRHRLSEQRAAAGAGWEDTGYVFTTRTDRPFEPRYLSRSFDRLVARAGLPPIASTTSGAPAATLTDLGRS